MKKMTISQAAKKLEALGMQLVGVGQYDLASKMATYRVSVSGEEQILTSRQIQELVK